MARFFLLLLPFLLVACNLPATQSPMASPTPDVGALQTQAVATIYAGITASIPPIPSPTITPVLPTLTPTPALPKIYFAGDTNCRQGPGVRFPLVTVIKEGQTAKLAGKPQQGDYWVVVNPNGSGQCWVVRDFATPSGVNDDLAVVTAPPTYTSMPRPAAPALANWDFSCEYASADGQSFTITVQLRWHDMSESELGYNIYRNDELIASLPPDTTAYTDVTYLVVGQGVTYIIEAWNSDGVARSKPINAQCQ
jgi:hypothetical protein